jgi:hypothetical protein
MIKGIGRPSNKYLAREHKKTRAHTAGSSKQPSNAVTFPNLCLFAIQQTFTTLHLLTHTNSVEMAGFEPATFALQTRCSPTELHPQDLPG